MPAKSYLTWFDRQLTGRNWCPDTRRHCAVILRAAHTARLQGVPAAVCRAAPHVYRVTRGAAAVLIRTR